MKKIYLNKIMKTSRHTIFIWFILASVIFIFSFKSLYYFDIDNLKIPENTGYSRQTIKENYNYLIYYNLSFKNKPFKLPNLPSSKEAIIHFIDVRNIVQILIKLLFIFSMTSILGFIYIIKNKDWKYFLNISIQILILPLLLSIPFIINFEDSFVIFHKIFFRNDYWQFDSNKDPIIDLLPETFFFHTALSLLVILLILSSIFFFIYKKKNK
ncbi:TIGR01906 family membrane protein [Peptostreptococcus equinus]|uniref:TIGR01906 family membrane protein n=1 Tax=Peptostreptococcus equinus TaxID=3003601 RepID=A0ABY7JSR8_9FIRM|nr:TIGR01906 family membrane protein [Peptostreptococcus sp. CBA3647]WAW15108.1 TIGR01906 family membrane protein [Peptostreptococcus sp. CBA3647]